MSNDRRKSVLSDFMTQNPDLKELSRCEPVDNNIPVGNSCLKRTGRARKIFHPNGRPVSALQPPSHSARA